MKEQTIIIQTFEEVEVDPNLNNVLGRYSNKSATFTEEEVSTLKTVISNLDEHGFLTMYVLVEYREIYVDPRHDQDGTKMIYHKDFPNDKVTIEKFAAWVQEKYDGYVDIYLSNWNYTFAGSFVWDDEECIGAMFEDFIDSPHFSVAHLKIIPNVLNMFLSKEQAEGQMQSYEGYYPEKMEVKEMKIHGSEAKVLHKLLSLLTL